LTSAQILQLGIKKVQTRVIINGTFTSSTTTDEEAVFTVSSRLNNKQYRVTVLVSPNITVNLPTSKADTSTWSHIQDVPLADPNFNRPSKIDLLIGVELFFDILQDGKRQGP